MSLEKSKKIIDTIIKEFNDFQFNYYLGVLEQVSNNKKIHIYIRNDLHYMLLRLYDIKQLLDEANNEK